MFLYSFNAVIIFSHPYACKQAKHCCSTTIVLAPAYYRNSVGKDRIQRTTISPSGSLDHYYSSEPITPQSSMAVLFLLRDFFFIQGGTKLLCLGKNAVLGTAVAPTTEPHCFVGKNKCNVLVGSC